MSCGSDSWHKSTYITVPFGKASAPHYLKSGVARILCKEQGKKKIKEFLEEGKKWVRQYKCDSPSCTPALTGTHYGVIEPYEVRGKPAWRMFVDVVVYLECLNADDYKKWKEEQEKKNKVKSIITPASAKAGYISKEETIEEEISLVEMMKSELIGEE